MPLNKYKILSAVDSITVVASDLDIRDLTHVSDSVKVGDGTDFLAVNGDGSVNAVVSATNLDIRDLVYTSDSVTAHQGGTWNVNLTDDSVADDDADTGNPFKVGGKAYDTTTALGAVSANDRYNLAGDIYRRTFINDAMNVGWTHVSIAVSTSAVQLDASKQAGRQKVIVQNRSGNNKSIFVGSSAGVIAGTGAGAGFEVPAGTAWEFPFGRALDVYAIGESGASNEDIRIVQAA